jgi:trimethylamine:corrinoid methyltransferase-like protein
MVIDRMRYDTWLEKGGKDMARRANERARKILSEQRVPPLPAAAEEVIADILEARGPAEL